MLRPMRVMGMALIGIAHPGGAASVMMGHMNHMARLGRVRLLQRLLKLVVPETLLPAAVAYDFEADGREPIHAERILCARRQIDNPTPNEGTAVVDTHCNAAASPLIANDHAGPERQALMRC